MALDEHTRRLLEQTGGLSAPRPPQLGPVAAREGMRARQALHPPAPQMERIEDIAIAGPGGAIRARLLVPQGGPRATIVYLHGGGWVLGDLDGFEGFGRRLADATGCATVVVDYRLAPEHPFPAAVEDAWAAVDLLSERVADGLLPGPLVVAGDSSGGNLAAATALQARDAGIELAAQLLIYPVVDCDFERPSYIDDENQLLLDMPTMVWFWDQYVPAAADRLNPDASPIRHGRFAGVAPAVIVTAEHDVLRDEGEDYADRLDAAGVKVHLRRFDGQMHGFASMPLLPASRHVLDFLGESLDALLSGRTANFAATNRTAASSER